jgi:hypothetical protein
VRCVEAGEDLGAGAQLGFAESVERRLDRFEKLVHVAGIGLDLRTKANRSGQNNEN